MKYPRKSKYNALAPWVAGAWYGCVVNRPGFSVGYSYLCCNTSTGYCLIDNEGWARSVTPGNYDDFQKE